MRYLLTILANGRDRYRERMEASLAHLNPQPAEVFTFHDTERLGMCTAHTRCWDAARDSGFDWVFHIEEDQVLLRPVDLDELRVVLDTNQYLKQMALVRCPWGTEVEHGGFIPQSPGWYERKGAWIETVRNWATSPAMFRTDLAREFPWPTANGCETAIGPQIRGKHPDAKFGLWGLGECWAAHIGVERSAGAHGY